MSSTEQTPFQALLKTHPYETAAFFRGASTIRQIVTSGESGDGAILAPLRGAMPIIWSSEGDGEYEAGYASEVVELPIGVFHYRRHDGVEKTTSPNHHQKKVLIEHYLAAALPDKAKIDVWMVDEVQKGSTITQAAKLARHTLDYLQPDSSLHVVAAQDSRKKVVAQQKVNAYMRLSSNSVDGMLASVVPMPLVPTDRDPMLDDVYLEGDFSSTARMYERLTIARNCTAERMFRRLATVTRLTDMLHDDDFMSDFINEQGSLTETQAARTEEWLIKMRESFSSQQL